MTTILCEMFKQFVNLNIETGSNGVDSDHHYQKDVLTARFLKQFRRTKWNKKAIENLNKKYQKTITLKQKIMKLELYEG